MSKKLIYEDANLYRINEGTELVGDGASDLDALIGGTGTTGSYFVASAIASSGSALPVTAVGDVFYDDGTTTPATGDNVYELSLINACDVRSASISAGKSQLDTTVMCDLIKAARSGKTEITGSITTIHTTGGDTDPESYRLDWFAQFIQLMEDDGAGTVTKTTPSDNEVYIGIFNDEIATSGEIESVYFLPIRLTNMSDSIEMDAIQEVSFDFSVNGGSDILTPQLYYRNIP